MNTNLLCNMLKTCVFVFLMFITFPVVAQNSGDKLYNQGLKLQQKQTIQSQKSAISKFKSAKKLYDSDVKKKQCDDAIAVSNNIIKTLLNKGDRKDVQNLKKAELKTSVLELSNEKLELDCNSRSVIVNITTTEQGWSITPITNSDGGSFVSVTQHPEDKNFEIVCSANSSTRQRCQNIEVRSGDLKKVLVVEQDGKPTVLSVEKTVVEFSSKGGNTSVEVYSNADSIEEDNNNRNWRVVAKPDWVNVVGEEYKEKGFLAKLGDTAKSLVKKNASSADDPSVVASVMKIVVASKQKSSPSRSGEIIIASENQQATIIVQQN